MKKSIQIITFILLVVASGTLFAQNNGDAIKKFAQSIRNHKSMEVSFTYQTVNDNSQAEEAKEGKAYFQDEAYKIIMEDQHALSDGKTTWHYIVADEEVMVGTATNDDNPFKILDRFERDDSDLQATFDEKGDLKKLEITVDEGVKLFLEIKALKYDEEYAKGFFTFDQKAYPNVDIIDMR